MRYPLLILFGLISMVSQAQTDDLMFVEYIDQKTGGGYGVTVFNPTNQTINLTSGRYIFKMQDQSGRTVDSVALTGNLGPAALLYIGNRGYCNQDCNGTCDFTTFTSTGINGNEKVALMKGPRRTFVDMIARWNDNSISGYRVGGVNNGLSETRIVRTATNCTRYTSTTGSGSNSWPSQSNSNVTGWTVTGLSTNRCLGIISFNTVFTPGALSIGADTTLCTATSYTINAPVVAGATIAWNTGALSQSIVVRNSGKYWATYTNGLCSVTDTINVTFGLSASAGLGADINICLGQRAVLKPSIRGTSTRWSNGQTTDSITITTAGRYSVIVTQARGCDSRDTIEVRTTNPNIGFLGPDKSICGGDSVVLTSTTGLPIFWSTGVTATSIRVGAAGDYTGTLVNSSPCQDKDTIVVRNQLAIIDTLPKQVLTCNPTTEILMAPAGYLYLWNTGDTSRAIKPSIIGKYEVRLTRNGCNKLTQTELKLDACAWFIPNFLTPNSDGLNDDFRPSKSVFKSATSVFFNRYGVEVGKSSDADIKWKPNGLPAGIYYYSIKAELLDGNPKTYKGFLEVSY